MNRVWTKVVIDMADGSILEAEGYNYAGQFAEAKGDSTAQQSEHLQEQNQQQQLDFNKQLMDIFQKQYGSQQQVLQYLQGKMQPIIDKGGQGYSDQALASMRTSATDTISNQYQNAQQALQTKENVSGGRDLPSGVNAQLDASLMAGGAAQNAGAQNQITQSNENLKQQNYWNAVNEMNGVGASFNPQSYASSALGASDAASNAAGSIAKLSEANTAASANSFWGKLGGSLAQGLGSGLGAGLAGGFGSGLSTLGSGNWGY